MNILFETNEADTNVLHVLRKEIGKKKDGSIKYETPTAVAIRLFKVGLEIEWQAFEKQKEIALPSIIPPSS